MPSRPGTDRSEFLKGKGDLKINKVHIFIGDHCWVKFSRCKPCLSIRSIESLQVDS